MTIKGDNGNKQRSFDDMQSKDIKQIHVFLKDEVDCWCNNYPDDWFTVTSLVGEARKDWVGIPLTVLHDRRRNKNSPNPKTAAGQDAGHMLRKVLIDDKREFECYDTKEYEKSHKYRLTR